VLEKLNCKKFGLSKFIVQKMKNKISREKENLKKKKELNQLLVFYEKDIIRKEGIINELKKKAAISF